MRKLFAFALVAVHGIAASACDVCGGAISGLGFGIIPFQQSHLIGIRYDHSRSESTHPDIFSDELHTSYELQQSVTIWGRYVLKNKYLLSVFVPVKANQIDTGMVHNLNGLGDVRLQGLRSVIDKGNSRTNRQVRWLSGLGLHIPVGTRYPNTLDLWPGLQPGTGSYNLEVLNMAMYRRNRIGVGMESMIQLNGISRNGYRYGHRASTEVLCFRRFNIPKGVLVPQLGLVQLYQKQDLLDARIKQPNALSGTNYVAVKLGVTSFRNSIGVRAFYNLPVYDYEANGYTKTNQLWNIQILYKFNS